MIDETKIKINGPIKRPEKPNKSKDPIKAKKQIIGLNLDSSPAINIGRMTLSTIEAITPKIIIIRACFKPN